MAIEQYLALSDDERDDMVADAILARELEYASYALNVQNYTDLLASMSALPAQWPPRIAAWKGKSRDEIAAGIDDPTDEALALALAHRDRIKLLLKTERHERDKVETYHGQLLVRLPAGARRDAALARLAARRAGG